MPEIGFSETESPRETMEEYVVPDMLGMVLRISQLICLAPAGLRRAHGHWAIIEIRPGFILFQRLLVFASDGIVILSLILQLMGMVPPSMYENTIFLSVMAICRHNLIAMLAYTLVMLNSPGKLQLSKTLLGQLQKMIISFKCTKVTKFRRLSTCVLFLYIAYQLIEIVILCYNKAALNFVQHESRKTYNLELLAMLAYVIIWYQNFTLSIQLLQWSLIIIQIQSTLSMLNDDLQSWLERLIIVHPRSNIYHLSDCYNEICDLIRKIDKHNGAFLLFSIVLIFSRLLLTPYNFLLAIDSQDVNGMVRQIFWFIFHICQLLTIVEPSHRLYQQQQRTRDIVCKLAGETGRWDLNLAVLEPFLLQMQMKEAVVAPMGMFHIARPLVASIFGGVATSLIIIVQFRTKFEQV